MDPIRRPTRAWSIAEKGAAAGAVQAQLWGAGPEVRGGLIPGIDRCRCGICWAFSAAGPLPVAAAGASPGPFFAWIYRKEAAHYAHHIMEGRTW